MQWNVSVRSCPFAFVFGFSIFSIFFLFFYCCGRVVNYSRWFCCRYIFSQLLLHEYLPLKSLFPKQKYITWLGAWGSILVPFFHIYHYGIKPYHVTHLLWNSKLILECRLQYIIQNHMWKKAGESDALGIAIRPFVNTNQNLPSNNQESSPRERRAIQKPNNLFACFALPPPSSLTADRRKRDLFLLPLLRAIRGAGRKKKKRKTSRAASPRADKSLWAATNSASSAAAVRIGGSRRPAVRSPPPWWAAVAPLHRPQFPRGYRLFPLALALALDLGGAPFCLGCFWNPSNRGFSRGCAIRGLVSVRSLMRQKLYAAVLRVCDAVWLEMRGSSGFILAISVRGSRQITGLFDSFTNFVCTTPFYQCDVISMLVWF